MKQIPFDRVLPVVDPTAFLAEGSILVGDVTVHAGASVWFNAVMRGDTDRLVLGERSNLQDNSVVHADPGSPALIGAGVSIGHSAVVHGCRIEDDCLIGMNATVLNGAVIGRESLVAAGSVVLEGTIVPPRSLVAGVPAKVRRELTDDEVAAIRRNADTYAERAQRYANPEG
ncbi:MAG: gamma carbonic anhydrase family protein [Microbacteriaceae bacterium]|nr:gamma carbonic anhydrase family protein [Microbacteriaceae bacterium]